MTRSQRIERAARRAVMTWPDNAFGADGNLTEFWKAMTALCRALSAGENHTPMPPSAGCPVVSTQ